MRRTAIVAALLALSQVTGNRTSSNETNPSEENKNELRLSYRGRPAPTDDQTSIRPASIWSLLIPAAIGGLALLLIFCCIYPNKIKQVSGKLLSILKCKYKQRPINGDITQLNDVRKKPYDDVTNNNHYDVIKTDDPGLKLEIITIDKGG